MVLWLANFCTLLQRMYETHNMHVDIVINTQFYSVYSFGLNSINLTWKSRGISAQFESERYFDLVVW